LVRNIACHSFTGAPSAQDAHLRPPATETKVILPKFPSDHATHEAA